MATALFRADASVEIGSGHIIRCLALASRLRDSGWICHFASRPDTANTVPALQRSGFEIIEVPKIMNAQADTLRTILPNGVQLLVVDHYELDSEFESKCQPWAQKVLAIDDLADRPHNAQFLLDQTHGRKEKDYVDMVPDNCKIMTGGQFALVRPEFLAIRSETLKRRDTDKGKIRRILVSLGNSDTNNVTGLVLESINESRIDVPVDIVLGKNAPHINIVKQQIESVRNQVRLFTDVENMATLMSEADLAVGAGGISHWERCCLGLPTLAITIADNQLMNNNNLDICSAIKHLGCHVSLDKKTIKNTMLEIYSDTEQVKTMSLNSRAICDGKGRTRVMLALTGENHTSTIYPQ